MRLLLAISATLLALGLSAAEATRLFNGNDLTGWHVDVPHLDKNPDAASPFIVRDGMLVSLGKPNGHLITDAEFANYRLEVEYRFAAKPGNCGVLVHASTPRALYKMFPASIEVQMFHKNAGDFWCIVQDITVANMEKRRGKKEKWGITEGNARRILNMTDGSEKPAGEWNRMLIECVGDEVKVWVNGDLVNYGWGCTAQKGQIALQAEGSEVEFRKVELTPIEELTQISFEKVKLDDLFRSEGVTVCDINKDGKNDICTGELWYEAPDWKIHEIREPRQPKRGGYTEVFAVYNQDFNQDGWVDILIIPFHGKDAHWYENPKNEAGHWTGRRCFLGTGNETRIFPDLFKDGNPVFVMGVQGAFAWVDVPRDVSKINDLWPVHMVGDAGFKGAHKYAHGCGVGDVNGDGRNDILWTGGWYEQPPEGRKHEGHWTYHEGMVTDGNTADIYAVDCDGDGRNDILASSAHGSGIFFSKATGDAATPTFTKHVLDKSIRVTHSLNYIDINGDGRKDLVTGQRPGTHGSPKLEAPSEMVWYDIRPGDADSLPSATMHLIDDQSGMGAQFVTEDFNGDGKIDVVTSGRKGVYLFRQN